MTRRNRLIKSVNRTYVPGTRGVPGNPGRPALPARWIVVNRTTCAYGPDWNAMLAAGYTRQWVDGYMSGGQWIDGQWYWKAPSGESSGFSIPYAYQCITEPYLVFVQAQSYIAPTPAIPPTPAQTLLNYNLGWTGRARSIATFTGWGEAKFKVPVSTTGVVVGLNTSFLPIGYGDIRFGLYCSYGVAQVMERGQVVHNIGDYVSDTEFRIQRKAGRVRYYVNDVEVWDSPNDIAPMHLDAALYTGDDEVYDPEIYSLDHIEAEFRPLAGVLADTDYGFVDTSFASLTITLTGPIVADLDTSFHELEGLFADHAYAEVNTQFLPLEGEFAGFDLEPAYGFVSGVLSILSGEFHGVSGTTAEIDVSLRQLTGNFTTVPATVTETTVTVDGDTTTTVAVTTDTDAAVTTTTTTVTENPDGSTTTVIVVEHPDGSTTTTTIETPADGSPSTIVSETVDSESNVIGSSSGTITETTNPDGSTTVVTETVDQDGNTTTVTETTTDNEDGSTTVVTETVVEDSEGTVIESSSSESTTITNVDGSTTTTTTTTNPDGSTTVTQQVSQPDGSGGSWTIEYSLDGTGSFSGSLAALQGTFVMQHAAELLDIDSVSLGQGVTSLFVTSELVVVFNSQMQVVSILNVTYLVPATLTSVGQALSVEGLQALLGAVMISYAQGASVAPDDSANFTAWVLNTETQATSRYERYPFNSFAKIGDSYYAAADDGLYELDGEDDNGAPVQAMVSFGKQDFDMSVFKAVPHCYMGVASTGQLFLRVVVGDDEYLYATRASEDSLRTQRVDLGQGLQAHYFEFEVYNSDGDDFELASIEFVAVPLNRRI